jgi:integration host factor subunit beta
MAQFLKPTNLHLQGSIRRSFALMNKAELILALKDSNNLSRLEAEKVVTLFFDQMAEALAQGERVEIRGLCSFFVKKYDGYTGRNPKTGELVKIAPKKLPFFKVGKELKDRVDG